jgi:hypothetical protein
VDALQLNCVSLQEQLDWAAALPQMRLEPPFEAEACGRWQAAVRLRLREAGGIDGSEPEEEATEAPERPPFQRPHAQNLDGYRLQRGRDAPPDESDAPAWRLYVFRNFMNEVGAGDNVASVVFDAPEHTDWGLLYDVARHGWDEYRHAMMGLRRLRDLGFDPAGLPLGTGTFEYRDRLSPLERFGMLVFIHEAPAFGYKHGSRKVFQSMGDEVSAEYMLYDICDETRHVANGPKWIRRLQAAAGDRRSHEELMADLRRAEQERLDFIGTGFED